MKNVIVCRANDTNKYCITKKKQGELNFKMNNEVYSFHLVDPDDEIASNTCFRYKGTVYAIAASSQCVIVNLSKVGSNLVSYVYYFDEGVLTEVESLRQSYAYNDGYGYQYIYLPNQVIYNQDGGYYFIFENKLTEKKVRYLFSRGGKSWTIQSITNYSVQWNKYNTLIWDTSQTEHIQYGEDIVIFARWTYGSGSTMGYYLGIGKISGYNGDIIWASDTTAKGDHNGLKSLGNYSQRPKLDSVVKYDNFAMVTIGYSTANVVYRVDLDTYEITEVSYAESAIYDEGNNYIKVYMIDPTTKKYNYYKTTDGINFELIEDDEANYVANIGDARIYQNGTSYDLTVTVKYNGNEINLTDILSINDAAYITRGMCFDVPSGYFYLFNSHTIRRTTDFVTWETIYSDLPAAYNARFYVANALTKPIADC